MKLLVLISAMTSLAWCDVLSDCKASSPSGDCNALMACCKKGCASAGGYVAGAGCGTTTSGGFDDSSTVCKCGGAGGGTGGGGGGGGSAPQDDATFRQEALDTHNAYRAKHGSPAMTTDSEVEAVAKAWAQELATSAKKANPHNPSRKYGENIFMGTGTWTAKTAVDDWYKEISKYDYNSPGYSSGTGHFTQVVWKASVKLGCGQATSSSGMTYIVCNYDPAGNGNDFAANVPPAS